MENKEYFVNEYDKLITDVVVNGVVMAEKGQSCFRIVDHNSHGPVTTYDKLANLGYVCFEQSDK